MRVTCLTDNAVQPQCGFWGEHGLAFLIESAEGRVLFDTGASGTVLLHNLGEAEVELESISALALSHAHRDHTGGLPALLERRQGFAVYAHPDLPRERFGRRGEQMQSKGLAIDPEILFERADLRLCATFQEILPGIWTSGELSDRSEPEGRSPFHFARGKDGWMPDPYRDDLALVLESSQGLVLLCGCCHAGLLNTLLHVRDSFGQDPVAVAGGMHLMSADEQHLRRLIEVLRQLGPPKLYPNHCTGHAAYVALAGAFGDRVAPCPAGTVLQF